MISPVSLKYSSLPVISECPCHIWFLFKYRIICLTWLSIIIPSNGFSLFIASFRSRPFFFSNPFLLYHNEACQAKKTRFMLNIGICNVFTLSIRVKNTGQYQPPFFMHKTLKLTSADLLLQKAGVVKVSSKCRQNPKNDVSRKSQKGKMP